MKNRLFICLVLFSGFSFSQSQESEEWSPKLKNWSPEINKEFCKFVSGAQTIEGNYFYSPAFIHLAEISGAVESPGSGKSYNMDLLDKDIIRNYLEYNFSRLKCGDVNFLSVAFETNNREFMNDLLEISIIFFNGSQYAYWNYDITKVKTNYGNGLEESFISYLINSEEYERAQEWLGLIDRRIVRSMKYIYQTNSKEIIRYLMKNDPEMINRLMQYGPGEKLTFIGYIESLPESERRTEWIEILRNDPVQIEEN